MLIGYVSDENYAAIAGVDVEFECTGATAAAVRTTACGAVLAELPSGEYRVTLACSGFGSKHVRLKLPLSSPFQFRLCSTRLTGYMWPKWARSGEAGEFRVNSAEPYHLSLHRYGIQKELVRNIGWFDAHGPLTMLQITPDGDYCGTGVAWNRVGWSSPHHTQLLSAPERSGLYYLHVRGESGAFFAFPWIVAPAAPTGKIAVLASNITWNAYNAFGGRSNYVNACGLPPQPTVNARQDLLRYQGGGAYAEWLAEDSEYAQLSFERPEPGCSVPESANVTDTIPGRDACHLAPAEWRTLAWLEREGFAYDLYSETQLHSGALDLDAYHALILNVHPEYWSREMFRRVHYWVHGRGGRLLYLAGNGLNCEVEFTDDKCSAMRCLSRVPGSGSAMGGLEPERKLESRMHRTFKSEAGLLGVACSDAGIMTAAPYRVELSTHWAFTGTGLRTGDHFGRQTLHDRVPGGASGHETDKRTASSPENTLLLARGANPDNGGAEMVLYCTPSGGAVFSVGSITYPAGLLIDKVVSRITRNVLERFMQDGPVEQICG